MNRLAFGRREVLAIALLVLGLSARARPDPGRQAWGIDYGASTDPATAERFGLLVLEPDFDRPLAPLRRSGTRLLGYISLGEVNMARPFAAALNAAEALSGRNPNWPEARYVDLRHEAWHAMVLDKLVPAILAKDFDGIFMDTLDNAEALEREKPSEHRGMVAGAARLVHSIRARFPGITIMMNRSYALLPAVVSQIDAILAEAMASRWSFTEKRYEMTSPEDWEWQAEKLRQAKKANPALALMTLDYWDPADSVTVARLYDRERSAGFQPYVATLALDRLLPEPRL